MFTFYFLEFQEQSVNPIFNALDKGAILESILIIKQNSNSGKSTAWLPQNSMTLASERRSLLAQPRRMTCLRISIGLRMRMIAPWMITNSPALGAMSVKVSHQRSDETPVANAMGFPDLD